MTLPDTESPDLSAPGPDHLAPDAPGPACELCGRTPAMPVYASMYTGRLLLGDEIWWKGPACRQCAICQYRAGLTHCLWAGWWAPVALVVNPRMIWRNARGLRAAHRLPESDTPGFDEPLDAGRPVLARPAALAGLLAPFVVVGALVALVLALTGGHGIDDLTTGDCIDLPDGRTVDRADVVDCSGPHDAEVTGTIVSGPLPADDELCRTQTADYLGPTGDEGDEGDAAPPLTPAAIRYGPADDVGVVCLVVAADGGTLTGSHRTTAR